MQRIQAYPISDVNAGSALVWPFLPSRSEGSGRNQDLRRLLACLRTAPSRRADNCTDTFSWSNVGFTRPAASSKVKAPPALCLGPARQGHNQTS